MPKDLIQLKLDALKKKMTTVVMADGVVSEDEQFLMDQIEVSLDSFQQFVRGMDNFDEKKAKFIEILRSIEDDALDAAEFDDLISTDEMGILSVLFDGIKELEDSTSK